MLSNRSIADTFDRVAELLEVQHADGYRVAAYRRGARALRELQDDAESILHGGGEAALVALPHIGHGLASAIAELVHTGRLRLLDRLEGEVSPEDLFTTVPGIGEELARRIHQTLHIDTLEELELAAHDGGLARVKGFGKGRIKGVKQSLASILSRSSRRRARLVPEPLAHHTPHPWREDARPSVALLLDVDDSYRRQVREGRLRKIAPRRFNPKHAAWLPIMHLDRFGWSFTVMFSNTARAHQLRRIKDWVVIYFERDGHENQCTVVTEHRGPDAGRRVVRGRERACWEYHRQQMHHVA